MSTLSAAMTQPPRTAPTEAAPATAAPLWHSFGAALTLEAAAVAGLLAWLSLHPAEPPLRVLPLQIEAAPAPAPQAPPTPPVSKPPPPAPMPQPAQRVPRPVAAPAAAPVPAPPLPVSNAPSEVAATPQVQAAAPTPVATPPAPPPPPPPAGPVGPSPEYIAKVRAAVQAAFVYPPAAVAADFHGRTRVGFTLRGTTPANARVLVGSGMGLVDRAALQSVQSASYPPPPPDMKTAEAQFEVWVEFKP